MNNKELKDIILSGEENVLVNKFAGGAKTTLCIDVLKDDKHKKRTYLTFNREMKMEMLSKLDGIPCNVLTFHGLAYNELKKRGWSPSKNSRIGNFVFPEFPLSWTDFTKRYPKNKDDFWYIREKYIKYCSNQDISVIFVNNIADVNHREILLELISEVNKQILPCSHSFYLKKYALSNLQIDSDFIIYDEFQDVSPLSQLIVENQRAKSLGVGDTYQNIYSELMGTVNMFDILDWKSYTDNNSYRINQQTADTANVVLNLLGNENPIVGLSLAKSNKNCKLYTTNFDLVYSVYTTNTTVNLIMAVEKLNEIFQFIEDAMLFKEGKQSKNWKFNNAIKNGKDIDSLINSYNLNEEFTNAKILRVIKRRNLSDFRKVVMSRLDKNAINNICTIHQSKGLTFNDVTLEYNEVWEKWFKDPKKYRTDLNLLYVAITRASGKFISDNPFYKLINKYDFRK